MEFYNFSKKHEKIIGGVASFLATVMFIALIEIFISNVQGKSDIFIQPLAAALSGFVWVWYSYARKDIFIFIPNILSLVLGVATAFSAFYF